MARRSDGPRRSDGRIMRMCLLLPAGIFLWLLLAAGAAGPAGIVSSTAEAVPAYQHATADNCSLCHHADSYASCDSCHQQPEMQTNLPNQSCTRCHSNKQAPDRSCWSCHEPGATQPEPTDETCAQCHTTTPHFAATPSCTTAACHGGAVTPHHDGEEQSLPTDCTDCHDTESHGQQDCTACHSATEHPDYPEMPETCSQCHSPDVFSTDQDCTNCHAGDPADGPGTWRTAGQLDDDIHDVTLPDGPIGPEGCTVCHSGRSEHAGAVACTTCHDSAEAFHHGNAASPGYPECRTCHTDKPQPAGSRTCQTCHAGAQHQAQPQVGGCSSCHGTGREPHAGSVACTTCHGNAGKAHHTRIPSPTSCSSCHEQSLHVDRVPCVWCHGSSAMHDATPLNLLTQEQAEREGRKGEGLPSARDRVCTQCHVEATTHALEAPAGADHSCATCHRGEVHGPISSPGIDRCLQCHTRAEKHAFQYDCRSCHWPAVHDGTPDAGEGGGQKKMKLYLPAGAAGGATDQGRTRLTDTGTDLTLIALAGILLLGGGIYLRRRKD